MKSVLLFFAGIGCFVISAGTDGTESAVWAVAGMCAFILQEISDRKPRT